MAEFELTGLARLPLLLLGSAEALGLDHDELIEAAGLSDHDLQDPDARVPIVKQWNLWRAVIDRVDDVALGLHLAERVEPKDLGVVGYSMAYSRDLRQALDRFVRYCRVISEAIQAGLSIGSERTRMTVEHSPQFDAMRHPVDTRLAVLVLAVRTMTGQPVNPVEVHFSYDVPEQTLEHRRLFNAPLKFGQPKAMLVFRNEDLDLPIVAADETLSGYLDRLAGELLGKLTATGSFTERIRRAIWSELHGQPPSLSVVASIVGVSPRTLQRRLREEQTSFAAVLDEFRREMAMQLLQDRSLAIYEVAFLLGYSEPSTFYRAFRRWRGASPDEFRRSVA